jgi:ABC-2 type transport system ATP-binding protein
LTETTNGNPAAPEFSVVAQSLTKWYGPKLAVDAIDLAVRPGEFFGILGPNGAGKSTTIKMLCGLVKPTQGRAVVAGHDVAADPLAVKAAIGIMPEEVNTYERLSARELLVFTGRMHGLARGEADARATELLRLVEINEEDSRKMVVDYSMGMRKKTVLAAALIHAPRVIFLDEPFNGIDAVTTQALRGVLQRLTERGVTILFSSHVLEVVEKLCTRIAIIHNGKKEVEGTLDEIREKTGHASNVALQDIFVKVVGGNTERGGLSWVK